MLKGIIAQHTPSNRHEEFRVSFRVSFLFEPGQRLCTVSFFFPMGRQSRYSGYKELMIRLVLASFQSALFVLPSHYGPTILTQARFIAEFRQAISAAGLPDASSFRGHSFRRGAASSRCTGRTHTDIRRLGE